MAPPPEYDKEPKAPDKCTNSYPSEESKVLNNQLNDHQGNPDVKVLNSAASSDLEIDTKLVDLDESNLKALLDEAITYKCPKDREGKSNLFKELLLEAEQDERHETVARLLRRGELPHANSLQDLVAALSEPRRRARPPPPVSARALHGGSLPSGVDTSFLMGEEPRGKEYVATVRCVNPSPLGERRVSASDAHQPDNEQLNRRSKAILPVTYTARATLEIGTRALTTTTASNHQVDSTIPFNCITSPEVVTSCTTTPSTSQSTVAVDAKAVARAAPAAADEYKKSLDENGNAVQGFGSPLSGSGQQKKPRRKKSSKNETVIKSHQIDGYQGNKDLNEVLRFIESNPESGRSKPPRAKHRDDEDKAGKKRSSERRKDKVGGSKPRASSLDAPAARARTPPAAAERRSWGSARQAYCLTEPDSPPPTAPELADFQTVTKKRRARRRPSPPPAPEPRSDSNDDLDSVHSLPALPPPAPPPAPTSYADIARTRHNIPDLIESCNYYSESAPGLEDYPALEARKHKGAVKKEAAAPDVVGQRRPAVVLRAAAPRGELDGVTFGFDVNEQLLGGCDLLLPVRGVLRYLPPPPPLPAAHLQHIVHYVATAWEDVVRCGGGKVHYFGE